MSSQFSDPLRLEVEPTAPSQPSSPSHISSGQSLPSVSEEQAPPSPTKSERPYLKRSASPDPSWSDNKSKSSSPHSNTDSFTPTRHRDSRPGSSRLTPLTSLTPTTKAAPLEGLVTPESSELVMSHVASLHDPINRLSSIVSPNSAIITSELQPSMSQLSSIQTSRPQSQRASQPPSRLQSQANLQIQSQSQTLSPVQLPQLAPEPVSSGWALPDPIRRLTNFFVKSGPPTPRVLSVSNPQDQNSGSDAGTISRSATPKPASSASSTTGAPAAAKGKLKVKIIEARGLGQICDPHVVAVFQRSQLISGVAQYDDDGAGAAPKRPIPMQRTDSSQGRFHAVPMRSRQSSQSSTVNRSGVRRSFTNPKWDAQGIFDVVDSDSNLDISVYEVDSKGMEIFYGHVTLNNCTDNAEQSKSWYPLESHADTNRPSGEIYVETYYQRADRKHLGPADFDILRLIGKGTFGQVYQVRKRDTQRIYAMKVLSKKVIVQKKEVAHTVGERNILVRTATSDSPFIVGLKFSFQTPSDLYLVTDYMSGGELFWHLQKERKFSEARAKFYIAELILAIQHLHENDIVYRDLKPENILLDANGHIALCDFGLSKANLTKNDTTTTFCGTTEYLAPEVLLDESGYTKMVDFWSLGVLVFEMCCGWSPFYAEDTQQMYKNIAFGKVRFPRDVLSAEGRSFVKGLLNRNPKHRLGAQGDAEELKAHLFFADINWDMLQRKLITPPFKPTLQSDTDVRYFDPEFTLAMDHSESLNARAMALAKGTATSTPLSPSVQANFQGFTYEGTSMLEENMQEHGYNSDDVESDLKNDYDNMDDINHQLQNGRRGGTDDDLLVSGEPFSPLV